jgi:hypothetical protein
MSIGLSSDHGTTNSTTLVEVVPPPGGDGTRVATFLSVHNRDAADIDVTLYKTAGATDYVVDRIQALPPGQSWRPIDGNDRFNLSNGDQRLKIKLGGVPGTQADWTSSWLDRE